MVDFPSEFKAHLESYRGPLDLLLFLIKKDEVDIFDIPISKVIEQYHIYLELIREVDPNLCGEFLVMAANLMEIKSKLLLPREELVEEGELEDPRLELVRQLLEYKKYKERAMLLEARFEEFSHRHERPSIVLQSGGDELDLPVDLGNVTVWDLLTAFHKIQLALGARVPHRVVSQDRPIEEYVAAVKEFLGSRDARTSPFEDLFAAARSRLEAIGFFLAILQMAKDYLIVVSQDEIFGTIEIRLRDEEETRRLLEEYADERREAPGAVADAGASMDVGGTALADGSVDAGGSALADGSTDAGGLARMGSGEGGSDLGLEATSIARGGDPAEAVREVAEPEVAGGVEDVDEDGAPARGTDPQAPFGSDPPGGSRFRPESPPSSRPPSSRPPRPPRPPRFPRSPRAPRFPGSSGPLESS